MQVEGKSEETEVARAGTRTQLTALLALHVTHADTLQRRVRQLEHELWQYSETKSEIPLDYKATAHLALCALQKPETCKQVAASPTTRAAAMLGEARESIQRAKQELEQRRAAALADGKAEEDPDALEPGAEEMGSSAYRCPNRACPQTRTGKVCTTYITMQTRSADEIPYVFCRCLYRHCRTEWRM